MEKGALGEAQRETRHKLLRVRSQWILTEHTKLLQQRVATTHGNVVYEGSSLKTQCPRLMLEAGHLGTLYLALAKMSYSKKKCRCSA